MEPKTTSADIMAGVGGEMPSGEPGDVAGVAEIKALLQQAMDKLDAMGAAEGAKPAPPVESPKPTSVRPPLTFKGGGF
jgi:hypothetical protein